MSTIRERDAAMRERCATCDLGAFCFEHTETAAECALRNSRESRGERGCKDVDGHHPFVPGGLAMWEGTAADRRALLAAGDALAKLAQAVVNGVSPDIRLPWGPYARLRAALAAWEAVAG